MYSEYINDNNNITNYYEAFYDQKQKKTYNNLATINKLTIIYEDDRITE